MIGWKLSKTWLLKRVKAILVYTVRDFCFRPRWVNKNQIFLLTLNNYKHWIKCVKPCVFRHGTTNSTGHWSLTEGKQTNDLYNCPVYCLDSSGHIQRGGTEAGPGNLLKLRRWSWGFKEVKGANIHWAAYQREESSTERESQSSAVCTPWVLS